MRNLLCIAAALLPLTATACIWDAQTLSHEKLRSHDLAQTILGTAAPVPEDPAKLRATIKDLEANRHEADPNWWNNLAGGYMRLGDAKKAVEPLEPIVSKFPNDYGIHANLGTAYHLLGRYADAEKEIARDLEINPKAHFGLEKYHLALLQYLSRDAKYQSRHVYVDEFTPGFLMSTRGERWNLRYLENSSPPEQNETNDVVALQVHYESLVKTNADEFELMEALTSLAAADSAPAYRSKWNLAEDANFEAGVIYMAQMNPKEPACWSMLGIVAWNKSDYHLAIEAFAKSIALGSPQSDILKLKIAGLNEYIRNSRGNSLVPVIDFFITLIILYFIYAIIRDFRRAKRRVSA